MLNATVPILGTHRLDFFTVDTVLLNRIYVLSLIELDTCRVYVPGAAPHPIGSWVALQARSLTMMLDGRTHPVRFLVS